MVDLANPPTKSLPSFPTVELISLPEAGGGGAAVVVAVAASGEVGCVSVLLISTFGDVSSLIDTHTTLNRYELQFLSVFLFREK